MRILHVVPTYMPAYRYGGPIYSVHGLCKALAARNHDVHVFTTNVDGPHNSDVPLRMPVNLDEVNVWYFPSKLLRRLYWSPPMAGELNRQMDQFDLVHLHSIFLWPTWAAARAARRFHTPYLLAPRGMLTKDLINRRSSLAKKTWIGLIERNNLEKAAAIHVTTEAERIECGRFDFRLPSLYVVPNGVDPVSVDTQPKQVNGNVESLLKKRPLMLFISRISWKKGLDRLIPALADIPKAHLIIAGNDDENYIPILKNLANRHKVRERVTFTGPVYGDVKHALLREADVFVLPSYSENFGIVVLEAMAAGCPVVITPEVGLADTVKLTGSGIVADGTPAIYASVVNGLLNNESLRKKMGEAGRRTVEEQFTWHSVAATMESVYEEVMSNYGRSR